MTAETDAKLIEEGRKLFAGEWQFVWASPSIETLPPMAGVEVAFAGHHHVLHPVRWGEPWRAGVRPRPSSTF